MLKIKPVTVSSQFFQQKMNLHDGELIKVPRRSKIPVKKHYKCIVNTGLILVLR